MNKATFTDLIPKRSKIIAFDGFAIDDEKYLKVSIGSKVRLFSVFRVGLADSFASSHDRRWTSRAGVDAQVQVEKMGQLFAQLYRQGIPTCFEVSFTPREPESTIIHFDFIVKTWIVGKDTDSLELDTARVEGAVGVGIDRCTITRLEGNALRDYVRTWILPTEPSSDGMQSTNDPTALAWMMPPSAAGPQFQSVNYAPPFWVPGEDEAGAQGIALGPIKNGTSLMHPLRIQVEDLKRHATILGSTGSGKTSSAKVIVRQISKMGIPVMVLDWHNEYGDVMKEVGGDVLVPGDGTFIVNPLEPDGSEDHVSKVEDIFATVYGFTHPQAHTFRNALMLALKDKGAPTLTDFLSALDKFPIRSPYDNETKIALQRRLIPLTEGGAGRALDGKSTHTIDDLMGKSVAVELDSIEGDKTKSIFADILLKRIYDYQRSRGQGNGKDHLLVVEEAKNIAPSHSPNTQPSIGENMSSEVRKFGEMMLFVSQSPAQLAADVMRNSGARIIHRLQDSDDLDMIRSSLDLNDEQRAHVANLGVGEAVVSLAGHRPILVQVQSGAN